MAENCYGNAFHCALLDDLQHSAFPLFKFIQSTYYTSAASVTEFLEAISGCWKWLGPASASSNDRDRAPRENQCLAAVQEWKCNSGTAPAARRATDFLDHLIDQGFIYLVRGLAPNLFPIQSQSTFIEEACWQSSVLWPFPRRSEPSADGTSVLICESPPRLNSHLRTHCALSIILSASLFFFVQ